MGQSSADVEREIEILRRETTRLVEELEDRARHAVDPAQLVKQPAVIAAVGAFLLTVVGAVVFAVRQRRTTRETPQDRWNSLVRGVNNLLARTSERRSEGMLKRVLWSMFIAGMVALAAMLAKRLSTGMWKATLHERPPEKVA